MGRKKLCLELLKGLRALWDVDSCGCDLLLQGSPEHQLSSVTILTVCPPGRNWRRQHVCTHL